MVYFKKKGTTEFECQILTGKMAPVTEKSLLRKCAWPIMPKIENWYQKFFHLAACSNTAVCGKVMAHIKFKWLKIVRFC